jgi:hypothetical protein
MGRATKIWIAALAVAFVVLPAISARGKYDPSAFHPFDAPDAYPCEPEVVGTDSPERLQGDASGVLGLGGNDLLIGHGGSCLRGGAGDDWIVGGSDRDSIDGDDGNDRLLGGAGGDGIDGGYGADVIDGGPGADSIDGEQGADTIRGGDGPDQIRGGSGHNRIDAGSGNDELSSVNGVAERVRCGPGSDEIWADRADRLSGCERVHIVRNPLPAVTPRAGFRSTTFHLSFRSPFNTDDPCDCAGFWIEQTAHPAKGGCGRTNITGWLYPAYAHRVVDPIRSMLRGGFCPGVYRGEVSFRIDGDDNCQTLREARGHRLDQCEVRVGIGEFSFRVR